MNYPLEYFKRETIAGFEVSSMMKRCWAAQMEVLEMFDDICRRHSIRYFLAYGTLLGAVRHGGFIPWDDDIDIWMLREDREKFTKLAAKDISNCGLELVSPYTDSSYENLSFRLINTRNYCLDETFLKKYWLFPFMAGLDIFTLNYVPRDIGALEELCTLMISANVLGQEWRKADVPEKDKREVYEQLIGLLGVEQVSDDMIPNQLWKLTDLLGGTYSDEEADMLTEWSYYTKNKRKIFSKEWFQETEYLSFEGISLPCPSEYAKVLAAEFGEDYMLPKIELEEREYPYYKDAHSRMLNDFEKTGINCPTIYREI